MAASCMLFDANIYGLGNHFQLRQGYQFFHNEATVHLAHYTGAVAAVAKEVRQVEWTGSIPSDALITVVSLLAAYNSPASDACNITRSDYKQHLRFNSTAKHDEALHLLVERKGGLNAIDDQEIADLIFW